MEKMKPIDNYEAVLRFWFPASLRNDHEVMVRHFQWWFGGGTDEEIHARFKPVFERALRGELDHWRDNPRSRLALIIVLDQFSRSLFRNSPRAYAQDPLALALTLEGLVNRHYSMLETVWEKTFFIMPLGHSERMIFLDRVVQLAEDLVEQGPKELRGILEHSASQARGHRAVIARFGRHPHRNALLGRNSTAAELAYLAEGTFVHTRGPLSLSEQE